MHSRTCRLAFLVALALLRPGLAAAQKLDKDEKKWLDDVRPILLAEEERTFKGLKDKGDRLEFQRIFWARRDPDLATPENEFEAEFQKARVAADQAYRLPTQAGSASDCGRVFILLGKPDEVEQESVSMSPGLRVPEVWTYRDKPGRTFQGGKAQIAFDAECRGVGGLALQMDRVAASRVLHPSIDYRKDKDGHIVKLKDQLPRDTAARALFKQPRQDFATAVDVSYLRVSDGSTALLGLVRGEAGSLAVAGEGAARTVSVSVAASAVADDGREAGWTEQTTSAPVDADGAFTASFKLGLKPGKYTLKAGAVDVKGGKAALATKAVEVPDLARVETAPDGTATRVASASTILVVRRIDDLAGGAGDPQHPFAAFELGRARLVPAFPGTVHKADQVEFFYQVYDLRVDPGTGKADASAVLSILKDGRTPVAKAPPNAIETEFAGSSVGPIPLSGYEPGRYVLQLKVTDKLAKKDLVQETPFEILP